MSGGMSRCDMLIREIVPATYSSRWHRYQHYAMTYDTLGETEGDQRWCEHCGLAVEPVGDDEPTCPACGRAAD